MKVKKIMQKKQKKENIQMYLRMKENIYLWKFEKNNF